MGQQRHARLAAHKALDSLGRFAVLRAHDQTDTVMAAAGLSLPGSRPALPNGVLGTSVTPIRGRSPHFQWTADLIGEIHN
jgi:hypothetical protein